MAASGSEAVPCFSPLRAFQIGVRDEDGYTRPEGISFHARGGTVRKRRGKNELSRKAPNILRELDLPCGQCVGCRLERSRQWAVRCMHESQLHESSLFVTLTYDDKHLPPDGGLRYRDFQLFMKKLRKTQPRARFYMCGEYGDQFKRPHYHACLFGVDFLDKVPDRKSPSGELLYRSPTLEKLWTLGYSNFGAVTFESAAYVARYVMKKMTGPLQENTYKRVDADTGEIHQVSPEFCRMSLKPGIGAKWLEKYQTDVYPADQVIINGTHAKPPRYYDKKLEATNPQIFEALTVGRAARALASSDDNTRVRLQTREQVTLARLKFKKRNLE